MGAFFIFLFLRFHFITLHDIVTYVCTCNCEGEFQPDCNWLHLTLKSVIIPLGIYIYKEYQRFWWDEKEWFFSFLNRVPGVRVTPGAPIFFTSIALDTRPETSTVSLQVSILPPIFWCNKDGYANSLGQESYIKQCFFQWFVKRKNERTRGVRSPSVNR